jgi:DNA-binding transcriptional regulator GbsR (MarR family)
MPTDAELTFADHTGRFYAHRYGLPPMAGRLLGYLSVCDPPQQSISELAEALLASRSAIAGALKSLEITHVINRTRVAGERMDRVWVELSSPQALGFDTSEYEELREMAREGLEVLRDKPVERQAVLRETAAFAEFVREQVLRMRDEWEARRAELVAAGELPARPAHGGQ